MSKTAPLKILIADDHAAMRRTVRLLFAAMDVTFLEAATGEEAVALFASQRPDWVIMDVRMPGMGGLRATHAIRQIDAQARVVAISQFTEPDYTSAAQRAGAANFVNKEELFQLLQIIQR